MRNFLKNKFLVILICYYCLIVAWWAWININGLNDSSHSYLYGGAYALIALAGGIAGLKLSSKWGGWKSIMGKGIIFLSLGLLGEAFGQLSWTSYNMIWKVEVPYPSIADIGYFSIIPFYALAMFSFARASGARLSLSTFLNKLQVVVVPVIMVVISYILFLRDYDLDLSAPIRVFFDLGYPMGEAITISIAILTLILSRNYLGGIMKGKIRYIIFAFFVQYLTDYTFLYHASREIYTNGGLVDLLYPTSFIVMSVGLFMLSDIHIPSSVTDNAN